MNNIYISRLDSILIKKLSKKLPQNILFIAYNGCRTNEVNNLFIDSIKIQFKVEVFQINKEEGKKNISIDSVRELYSKTKSVRKENELLIVQINQAHLLSIEAQNAMLKLLEEPPFNVHFIMSTNKESALISTILSRCFIMQLNRPSKSDLFNNLKNTYNIDKVQFNKFWLLCGGRVASLISLIEKDQNRITELNDAKKFIFADSNIQKMQIIIKYGVTSNSITGFAIDVMGIYGSILNHLINTGNIKKINSVSKKILILNKIIINAQKSNINKRVIQMMMSEL